MNSIMDILNIPFGYILKFCNFIFPNYALTLLLFAIIMKILLFPLGIKQQKNMVKQAALRPKEMAIRKKYAGRTDRPTQQKMNEEIMDLYQKENYSPTGGCLPLLIQFPVIIALYNVIRNPLHYIYQISAENITAIKDALVGQNLLELTEKGIYKLTSGTAVSCELDYFQLIRDNFDVVKEYLGDLTVDKLPDFHLFGNFMDLSGIPSFDHWDWLLILPVLTFVFSFLSMKLTRKFSYQPPQPEGGDNTALSMKIMDFTMPLFSVYISFMVPGVVALYWMYQNVLGVVQQYVMSKMFPVPTFTEEDYKAAEKAYKGSNAVKKKAANPSGEKVRSLHHIDDEEVNEAGSAKAVYEKEEKKEIERPILKENADGSTLEEKTDEKPKVRSLHHIDD